MRDATFAKRSLLNRPAPFPSGKAHPDCAPAGLIEQVIESKIVSAAAHHPLLSHPHKLLARAVYDPKSLLRIEGKDRHINLHQHFLQQCDRFHRSQALSLQGVGKSIDLKNEFTQRVVAAGTTRAEGKILLAECSNHVGECLQRTHDLSAQSKSADEPGEYQEEGKGPLSLRREAAEPQHQLANAKREQAREKRIQHKAPLEAHLFFLFALRRCRYGMPEDVELRGHISGCDDRAHSGSSQAPLPRD